MMSRRQLQIFVFILASVLEVQVKADMVTLPEARVPMEVPTNCLLESSICSIKTNAKQKYTFEVGEQKVVLLDSTVFMRTTATSGSLISGTVYLNPSSAFVIETPYGSLKSEGAEYFVIQSQNEFIVEVLSGKVVLSPLGHSSSVDVNAGYQNRIGRVNKHGQAYVGIPGPLSFQQTVKRLAKIHSGDKKVFGSRVQELHKTYQDAVYESSLIHKELVRRELASQEEKQRQAEIQRKNWEQERAHWRQILLKRTFE